MTADRLYDALEFCLQALDQGEDLEACLARFPALADELRPILETAIQARGHAAQVHDIPPDAMRRGRARVLQHAAELRERDHLPFWRRPWQTGRAVRALATSLTTVVFLFSGGTGLVFASSNSLPGDNLYPVKRSWEGVQLAFIFDPATKLERETEFEHERVTEIHELFSESRQEQVDFQGVVTSQQADFWEIAGLQIALDHDMTTDGQIFPGALVQVTGETEDGIIKAEHIQLIEPAPATATPSPQQTPTLRPTQPPTETKEPEKTPEKTIEPDKTEISDGEKVEPKKTESGEKKPNEDGEKGGEGSDD